MNTEEQILSSQNESLRRRWNLSDDEKLKEAISIYGTKWKKVAEHMGDCTPSQCCQRWKRIKPNKVKFRQDWTAKEDNLLRKYVREHGQEWSKLTKILTNRTGKQIRERFLNHLDPKINKEQWSSEEDKAIVELYQEFGSKWSEISKRLPGRPELSIKNRFYSHLRRHYLNIKNPYFIRADRKNDDSDPTPATVIRSELRPNRRITRQSTQSQVQTVTETSQIFSSNLKETFSYHTYMSQDNQSVMEEDLFDMLGQVTTQNKSYSTFLEPEDFLDLGSNHSSLVNASADAFDFGAFN